MNSQILKIHNLDVNEQTIIINEWGYYFDYLFEDIDKNIFSSIEKINPELNEIKIISYPTYDEILLNLEKLKKSKAVVLLYPSQEREIKLLSAYYKIREFNFNLIPFLDFIKVDYFSFEELFELGKTNQFFKYIYLFAKLKPIFNLNPSKCYGINKNNYQLIFTKSDFKTITNDELKDKFPNAYLYYVKAIGSFSNDIFLDLILHDLENYSDERIEYILKLIQFDDIGKIDVSKLNVSPDIIRKYEKEIAWIKQDGSMFMIGGDDSGVAKKFSNVEYYTETVLSKID